MSDEPVLETNQDSVPAQDPAPAPAPTPAKRKSKAKATVIDEGNKAVSDVAPDVDPRYSDVIVYLRGGDKACFTYGETLEAAHALFREYAGVDGIVEAIDGPAIGDRVLYRLAKDVIVLHPLQSIPRLLSEQ